ncbi:MAG: NUMOD3 domain-containing DNA-binding protein [archaeon]
MGKDSNISYLPKVQNDRKDGGISKYSVYELWVAGEESPFYVGKGIQGRPYWHLDAARKGERSHKSNKIRKAWRMSLPIIIKHVHRTDIEEVAFGEEKRLIKFYGRMVDGTGVLTNLTDGGEGASGAIRSEETRQKLSMASKGNQIWLGKTHSEESKLKISLANKGNQIWLGKTHSDESKLKISIAAKNRISKPLSEEHKQNIRKALLGKPFTEEHRQNSIRGHIGRKLSEEHKQNISKSLIGRPVSEETRRKLSIAGKSRIRKPVSEETRLKMSIFQKNRTRKPLSEKTRQKIGDTKKKYYALKIQTQKNLTYLNELLCLEQ